jgi:SAM-dependent methyltransferase
MIFNFRETMFRIWYWYVSTVDKNAEVIFMNYGYNEKEHEVPLDQHHEPNRFSVQLYHHLTHGIEIAGKDIVEIGCGRGGGLSYLTQTFAPKTALGVDLEERAVKFSNKYYKIDNLKFKQGDAQNLSLDSNSCDIVFNVESSHRYPDFQSFLREVSRILRPGGHFLITDFRYAHEFEKFQEDVKNSGFKIVREKDINQDVVEALNLDDQRRRNLVYKLTPKFLHKIALNFAGTVGSPTYNQFAKRDYIYYTYILKKN